MRPGVMAGPNNTPLNLNPRWPFRISQPKPPQLAAAEVTETPPPGGAVAAGTGPVAVVTSINGGGTALGTTPAPRADITIGGGTALGTTPTAAVATVTIGG